MQLGNKNVITKIYRTCPHASYREEEIFMINSKSCKGKPYIVWCLDFINLGRRNTTWMGVADASKVQLIPEPSEVPIVPEQFQGTCPDAS